MYLCLSACEEKADMSLGGGVGRLGNDPPHLLRCLCFV